MVELNASVTPTMTFLGVNQVKFLYYDPANQSAGGQIIGVESIDANNNQALYTWNAYEALQALPAGSNSFLVKATTGSLPGFFAMGSKPETITIGCDPGDRGISGTFIGDLSGELLLFWSPIEANGEITGSGRFGLYTGCLAGTFTEDFPAVTISITLTTNDDVTINLIATGDYTEYIWPGSWAIISGPDAGASGTFELLVE